MESFVAIFIDVYTCCTASYKAVSDLIEMQGFDKGEKERRVIVTVWVLLRLIVSDTSIIIS